MKCPECYSENPRITPLLDPEHCLTHHMQFICSTCGRHVCIDKKGDFRARCFMPFSSPEIAALYLKCAEILSQGPCGIYEITDKNSGRRSYKIYSNPEDLEKYLKNTPNKACSSMEPLIVSANYCPVKPGQVRRLTRSEVEAYFEEQKK